MYIHIYICIHIQHIQHIQITRCTSRQDMCRQVDPFFLHNTTAFALKPLVASGLWHVGRWWPSWPSPMGSTGSLGDAWNAHAVGAPQRDPAGSSGDMGNPWEIPIKPAQFMRKPGENHGRIHGKSPNSMEIMGKSSVEWGKRIDRPWGARPPWAPSEDLDSGACLEDLDIQWIYLIHPSLGK